MPAKKGAVAKSKSKAILSRHSEESVGNDGMNQIDVQYNPGKLPKYLQYMRFYMLRFLFPTRTYQSTIKRSQIPNRFKMSSNRKGLRVHVYVYKTIVPLGTD